MLIYAVQEQNAYGIEGEVSYFKTEDAAFAEFEKIVRAGDANGDIAPYDGSSEDLRTFFDYYVSQDSYVAYQCPAQVEQFISDPEEEFDEENVYFTVIVIDTDRID